MTSKISKYKLKIIPLDEEQRAHEELESACNDVNGSTQRVFDWTVKLINIKRERYYNEGKSADELRKICREIWKRHPNHRRQIIRVFDWKNSITGERPYRQFKGKYDKADDDTELFILKGKKKVSYVTFDTEAAEEHSRNIEELEELIPDDCSTEDQKKLLFKLQETVDRQKERLKNHGVLPDNLDNSNEEFQGLEDPPREKITLKPAQVPESEQLRMLQEMEGKQMYAMSRSYKSLGDSLIKMNYISDDPKVSERLIASHTREMMTLAFTSLQILNEFMGYFEKFKSEEMLTEEDKDIIRMLLRTLSQLEMRAKEGPAK